MYLYGHDLFTIRATQLDHDKRYAKRGWAAATSNIGIDYAAAAMLVSKYLLWIAHVDRLSFAFRRRTHIVRYPVTTQLRWISDFGSVNHN